jgi:hypothetical protein
VCGFRGSPFAWPLHNRPMRASDLPVERVRGRGDEPAGWPAGRLAELRQRLERLPPGHPSAPDWAEPDPGELAADPAELAADQDELAADPDELAADPAELAADQAELAAGDDSGEYPRDKPAPDDRERVGPGRPWASGGLPGEWQSLGRQFGRAGPGAPYRPWFTDADWARPWFTGEIW